MSVKDVRVDISYTSKGQSAAIRGAKAVESAVKETKRSVAGYTKSASDVSKANSLMGKSTLAVAAAKRELTGYLGNANKNLKSYRETINRYNSSVRTAAIAGSLFTAGIVAMSYKIAKTSEDFAIMKNQFMLFSKDAKQAEDAIKALKAESISSGTAFDNAAKIFIGLARVRHELGASQDDLLTFTSTIQKSLAITGNTGEAAKNGLIQLNQALASGTLRGDEFRSVAEQLPEVSKMLADQLGIGLGKLREMAYAGELTRDKVFAAILAQSKQINENFKTAPETMSRAWNRAATHMDLAAIETDRVYGLSDAWRGVISDTSLIFKDIAGTLSGEVTPEVKLLKDALGNVIELGARLFGGSASLRASLSDDIDDIAPQIARVDTAIADTEEQIERFKRIEEKYAGKDGFFSNLGRSMEERTNFTYDSVQEAEVNLQKLLRDRATLYKRLNELANPKGVPGVVVAGTPNNDPMPAAAIPGVDAPTSVSQITAPEATKPRVTTDPAVRDAEIAEEQIAVSQHHLALSEIRRQANEVTYADEYLFKEMRREAQEAEDAEETDRINKMAKHKRDMARKDREAIIAEEQRKVDEKKRLDEAYAASAMQLSNALAGAAKVGMEQGRMSFEEYKKIAKADAIVSTYLAANKALAAFPPPANYVAMAAVIVKGLANVATINSQKPAGREYGGPVMSGNLYQVGEHGQPEILKQGSKNYLIPGDRNGNMQPMESSSPSINVTINNNMAGSEVNVNNEGDDLIIDIIPSIAENIQNGGEIASAISTQFGVTSS